MSFDLDASYAYCRQVARRADSSFYYTFLLLPRAKRRAMHALYAFLRRTDDLADELADPSPHSAYSPSALEALARWRRSLDRALEGHFDTPLFLALADTVARFAIPPQYLYAVLDGVAMDLEGRTYETFAELEEYCYRVASVVGLACIHVWGFDGPAAFPPARQCGLAFQLTNILRDLEEDAARGRVYLPRDDLRRFGYSADELRRGVRDARFRALVRFEVERAEEFYRQGERLPAHLHVDGRAAFGAMLGTYRELLAEIKRRDGDLAGRRVRLSGWRKLRIAGQMLLGQGFLFPRSTA